MSSKKPVLNVISFFGSYQRSVTALKIDRARIEEPTIKTLMILTASFILASCSQVANGPSSDLTAGPAISQADDPLALWPALTAETDASDNIVYSPVSTAQALGLVHLGAKEDTARQIEAFLGTGPGDETTQKLARQRQGLATDDDTQARVKIANALFLSSAFSFQDSYVSSAKTSYTATTDTVDFRNRPGEAADTINRWANAATEGLISTVTDINSINRDAAAYLTNATFFDGSWAQNFRQTKQGKFLFGDGVERDFMMMNRESSFATAASGGWKAVRLPYGAERFVMDVILPNQRLASLPDIAPADIASLGSALGEADKVPLRVILPRFQASMRQDLIKPLQATGLTLPFSRNQADLSGMIIPGGPRLYIEEAFQVAKLEVFEVGTRAAAVTAMVAVPVSMPPPFEGVDFPVDRPFLFAIRDLQTGSVLFFGRIVAPEPFTPSPKP